MRHACFLLLATIASGAADVKLFVIPLRTRKIERIISTPPGSGPDPYLPLR